MKKVQKGRNLKFPVKIETWKIGESIPEWLSDRARIEKVDPWTGEKTIKMNNLTSGGVEIISSDLVTPLIKTTSMEDYVCFGDGKIISLTETQMNLLYRDEQK